MAQRPLIIGVTGPTGAGRSTVAGILGDSYGARVVSMSGLLREHSRRGAATFAELQDIGDELCRDMGDDAVAGLVLDSLDQCADGAVVVDGFKRPAEIRRFRTQSDFLLIAVQARTEVRWERVRGKFPSRDEFDKVDRRDNREVDQWGMTIGYGQRVADCVALADAMVWNDLPVLGAPKGDSRGLLQERVDRTWRLLTEPGAHPPTLAEIRMAQAYTVALRSSCLQRSVGAVVMNEEGRILAEGHNEVPRGQKPCVEEYQLCYRAKLRDEEIQGLAHVFRCGSCESGGQLLVTYVCTSCRKAHAGADGAGCSDCGNETTPQLVCGGCGMRLDSQLPRRKHLDYCRALHAEENAILQVSKNGGVGLDGATILVTTFPCALCAKKIVSCGISRVIFSEPYNVPEAMEVFQNAGTTVEPFEGFMQSAFHRVFVDRREALR